MYINFQTIRKMLFLGFVGATTLVSCSKSDDNNGGKPTPSPTPAPTPTPDETEVNSFFIDAGGAENKARYVLLAEDVTKGEVPLGSNKLQLKPANGYFWLFNKNIAAGLSYEFKGAGIGVSYARDAKGEVSPINEFEVNERATTFGFFDNYYVTAVSGQAFEGKNDGSTFIFRNTSDFGVASRKTIHTNKFLGDNMNDTEIVSFAGILDNGNGEFLTGMLVSEYKDVQPGQGSSTGYMENTDVVYVGVLDKELNLKRYYKSDKLSYSAGRFKSQYLLEMGKVANGDVYVFSGAIAKNPAPAKAPAKADKATTKPAGALRIKAGATTFDDSYFFDISAVSNNGLFRRVWHITGNKFLVEFFNDAAKANLRSLDVYHYAIVDVEAKTLNWVAGLPEPTKCTNIVTNPITPAIYGGKVYLPVNEQGTDPAIYVIDPATNAATKGLVVKGATVINAIGRFE